MPIVLNRAQDSQPSAGLIAGMYANMGLRENKRMYADDFYSIALIINTGIAFSIMPASVADRRCGVSPGAGLQGEGAHAAGLSARLAGYGHPVVRVAHQAQALNNRKPGRPRTLVRDAPVVYGCSAAR